ncbi:ATP-binding protein [Promethearchaeum syntrophicum]|uniref:ATP-binding protein n=1 Tax=Promethearchaeum syntrophicum TaxID=2594042 RepID=A0A5B9D5Z6_9ARCH
MIKAQKSIRLSFFYIFTGMLFTFSNILGAMYSISLPNGILLSGGSIAYCALIMNVLLIVITERNPRIIRYIIFFDVILSIFFFVFYKFLVYLIENEFVVSIFEFSSSIFSTTSLIVIVGAVLFIIELLFMVFAFEFVKKKIKNTLAISVIYIAIYILLLIFDGFVFPLIAFPLEPSLQELMSHGTIGKLLLGTGFSIPIIIFMVIFREKIVKYYNQPLSVGEILLLPRKKLIDELERQKTAREASELNLQKLESIGILAGGLGHDYNNILGVILLNASLIQEELKSSDPENGEISRIQTYITEALENIALSVENGKALSKQLLLFAKLKKPNKKECEVHTLIKNVSKLALSGSQVSFKIHKLTEKVNWILDESQIFQVILNLLINSKQAMPKGGQISIYIEEINPKSLGKQFFKHPPNIKKEYLKIIVKDQGIGIPKEDLKRIFDPYFTTKANGKGLGLSVSHSIIHNHNGFLHVESTENKGTIIGIYLPKLKNTLKQQEHINKIQFEANPLNILVMDDEKQIGVILKKILEKENHSVNLCKNGDECLKLFEKSLGSAHEFDLIILDLTIKNGLGGLDTIKQLKKMKTSIKVIAMSGYHDSDIIKNPKKYEFVGSIQKPFNYKDIQEKIRKVYNNEK